jgi:hypothetical protein
MDGTLTATLAVMVAILAGTLAGRVLRHASTAVLLTVTGAALVGLALVAVALARHLHAFG